MFFDAQEFHTSNKEVANILSQTYHAEQPHKAAAAASLDTLGNANWGDDEELDIDDETMIHTEKGETE